MTHPTTRGVRAAWRWPTAEECEDAPRPTLEQAAEFGRAFERVARELAALICRECDITRQPIHVPVVRFLVLTRNASAWAPPAPADDANAGVDPAGAPGVPGGSIGSKEGETPCDSRL